MSQLALFIRSLRWGMSIPKALLALAVFSLAHVHAQTVLVDEDWQDPLFENNKSRNTGDFTGWSFNNQWVYSNRDDRTNSVPGDSGFDTNQILNLVYTSAYLDYDISHSWAEGDVYYLRIEASQTLGTGTGSVTFVLNFSNRMGRFFGLRKKVLQHQFHSMTTLAFLTITLQN